MKFLLSALLTLALTATASAQQAPQSPMETVLANKLMAEISSGLQCSVAAVNAAKQIADLQKQLDDLKAKYEPPK